MRISVIAEEFIKAYYQNKEQFQIIALLHPDIRWSSLHTPRILRGIQDVQKMLAETFEHIEYHAAIQNIQLNESSIDNEQTRVFYQVDLEVEYHQFYKNISLYGSLLIKRQYISEVYMSLFASENQLIEHLVEQIKTKNNYDLEKSQYESALRFQQVNDDLEVLTNNVPGGIFKCLYNEELTILHMSEGFLSMVGYSRDEIKTQFHNSFWEMIDPQDRITSFQEVERQLKFSKTKQIEYRIIHKNGNPIWVLDRGQLIDDHHNGCPSFYCIMIDITEEKKVREELNLALERFNILIDQTNDVIFEWDISKDELKYSRNLEKVLGQKIPNQYFKEFLNSQSAHIFHKKDIYKLKEIVSKISQGQTYLEEELRLLNQNYQYQWWHLRLTLQLDKKGQPFKVIGMLIDIDEEKRQSQDLLNQAQKDALTGIYNKATVQKYIKRYLNKQYQDELSALMIIDIDNFKEINDRMGHLFGDAVLSDIARRIKSLCHQSDIVGRIGGDEFIVFLKDMKTIEVVQDKAQLIIKEMSHLQADHQKNIPISCSIGISLVPVDGNDFTMLFQKADRALYQAKNEGKNQYTLYDEKVINDYLRNTQLRSVVNEIIDSNENSKLLSGQLAEYVFRVLYNTQDVKAAISSILEIVGLQYDVSRVYIFENIENDNFCCNTFEWCHEGIEPQIELLSHVSYQDDLGGHYLENFNEEGIFYCSDITNLPQLQYEILEPQGIKSLLQCAIKDNGIFKGYVGFDECRQNRYWTQDQIDALVFISEILSVFLLKSKAESSLKQETASLLQLLDNQNSFIYVVNPKDYHVLFINKKSRELSPYAQLGMPCYKVFMQQDRPCEHCPIELLKADKVSLNIEKYNVAFDLWVDVDATAVTWEGQSVVMLTCHDVTRYKK